MTMDTSEIELWRHRFNALKDEYRNLGPDEAQRWALSSLMEEWMERHPEFGDNYRQAAVSLGRICGSDLAKLRVIGDRERH